MEKQERKKDQQKEKRRPWAQMKNRSAKIDFGLIQEAFECLTQHAVYGPKMRDKWLSANTFVDGMKEARYFSKDHANEIRVGNFNAAMAKSRKWGIAM